MSEPTIARYDVDNSGETVAKDGLYVLYTDHESALAALRAEFEQGREGYEAGCREVAQDALDELTRLRTAIGKLADEREKLAAQAKTAYERASSETNRAECWAAWQINQSIAAEIRKIGEAK